MLKKNMLLLFLSVVFIIGCTSNKDTEEIILLFTNDEHGWMEPTDKTDGAAGLVNLWKENENFIKDDKFLILSGGDITVGPAISSWQKGKSMIEVMNEMHYDAVAVGNHEFDFDIDELKKRIGEAKFSFLAANMKQKSTGKVPEFITPYIIRDVKGVKVGIIGLSNSGTSHGTSPQYVKDFEFTSYESTLSEYVPQMKNEGAELLIVLGHIPGVEMRELVPKAKELGISIICGGHYHEQITEIVDGVVIIESGDHMKNYVKVEIQFDKTTKKVVKMSPTLIKNISSNPDQRITSIVSKWREPIDKELSEVIGFTDTVVHHRKKRMYKMITDSWISAFPNTDVSILNIGGIRHFIPQGIITLETIVNVLPLQNTLISFDMLGQDLLNLLKNSGAERLVFGGVNIKDGFKLSDGKAILVDSIYKVLTVDYLYYRDDYSFQKTDENPKITSTNYREPLIDWIKSLNTTSTKPLNSFIQ